MQLEKQVCSLEQAKKLKELGIVQLSLFSYDDGTLWGQTKITVGPIDQAMNNCAGIFSAFTVAELGQMLGRFARNTSSLSDGGNEAFDRADDLIHLLEIGELLVDGCNERLAS